MKNIIIFITILFPIIVKAQTISWFEKNTIEFTDFSFIKTALKDKKYVFIGESSHGANEFFELRSELSKYLIDSLNFEVVTFESPLVASVLYNQNLVKKIDTLSHSEHILFPIFCNSINRDFVNYLDSKSIPVFGFDSQLGTEFQAKNVTEFVHSKMILIDSILAKDYLEVNTLFSKNSLVRFSKNEVWHNYPCVAINDNFTCQYWLNKYNTYLFALIQNYQKLLDICEDSLTAMTTIKAVQTIQIDLLTKINKSQLYIRDSIMAENINLIISLNPNKKIIFLAHNAHIAKDYQKVKSNFSGDKRTMFSFLPENIKNKSLVVGLYGIKGATNYNNRTPKEMTAAEQENTIEYSLKDKISAKAYVNLSKYSTKILSKEPQTLNLCHWGIIPEEMIPYEQFDYLIFLKELTPSSYLD